MTKISHGKKSRVLLVDDEIDMIDIVKAGLERKGFEVDSYIDPTVALQNFKRGSYQLLILDIKMPKMNGMDLLDRIKKEDDNIKVCFFTASEEFASNCTSIFNNSKDKFLIILKPISIPIMTKRIEQFLSR
jgi:two-component system, OmpR family, response regulator ChvI